MDMRPAPARTLVAIAIVLFAAVPFFARADDNRPAPPSTAASSEPAPGVRKIAVTAKKFEFNPETIEVAVGESVELTITSLDKKHGFKCPDLHIEGEVDTDKPLVLTFKAEKAGTYDFRCSKFCGLGHGRMKGKIVVR